MTPPRIAYLGMGTMGSSMAANLARKGFPVSVWNRSPDRPGLHAAREAGCRVAPSIADAVSQAELVLLCVGGPDDVKQVLLASDGAAQHAPPNTLFVDMSTIGPAAAREVGTELARRGHRFLDAPVSGGDIGARNGTLTIMVGGEDADFAAARPAFEAMGKNIHLCGPVGAGQGVKMINQQLAAATTVAVAEAIALSRHLGLDPRKVVEVTSGGAAGSWSLTNLAPRILDDNFTSGFALEHMRKDLRLLQESIAAAGPAPDLPQLAAVSALLQRRAEQAPSEATQSVYRLYEEHPRE